jgi:hypothetical protein
MSRQSKRALLLALLAVPFSELGHLVAYGVRVPSAGAHLYFPLLLQLSGAALGAALLPSLALLAAACLLTGRQRRTRPWSFPIVFVTLLSLQLAVFLLQESLESRSLPSLGTLSVGLLGQQPVALTAALVLRWLTARLGPAAQALSSAAPARLLPPPVLRLAGEPVVSHQPPPPGRPGRARGQRGPPL